MGAEPGSDPAPRAVVSHLTLLVVRTGPLATAGDGVVQGPALRVGVAVTTADAVFRHVDFQVDSLGEGPVFKCQQHGPLLYSPVYEPCRQPRKLHFIAVGGGGYEGIARSVTPSFLGGRYCDVGITPIKECGRGSSGTITDLRIETETKCNGE